MSVYSDRDLADLYPEYRGAIGPASIDLHIGETLRLWPSWVTRDPRIDQSYLWRDVAMADGAWTLKPGIRYLATTLETLRIPDDAAGQLAARSSWGRDGLAVIQGPAGWCDPGYHGRPTMELSVTGSDLILWPGASICQLILFRLTSECLSPYRGKYQGDAAPIASRLHMEVPS